MPSPLALLKRKVGPFPVGVWAVIVVGGVGVAIVIRRRTAAIAGGVSSDAPAPAGEQVDSMGLPFVSDQGTLPFSVGPPVFAPPYPPNVIDDTGLMPGGGVGSPQRVTIDIVQRIAPPVVKRPKPKPVDRKALARARRQQSAREVRRQPKPSPAEQLARRLRRRDPRLTKQQARRRAKQRLGVK